MFTGIIEQQGEVIANKANKGVNHLIIKANFDTLEPGESIAINGVCLTLLKEEGSHLAFDISPETLNLTTLNDLKIGAQVNLERSLCASSRFGGHYVSGHVDTTACLKEQKYLENCMEIMLEEFPAYASMYLLPKGSITLDGVSLTINAVEANGIRLMLVPYTLAVTTLGQLKVGQRLNVEFDYLTRIVAHQLKIAGHRKEV